MTFRERCRKVFLRRLEMLGECVKSNAPDFLLANNLVAMLRMAEGAFGDELHAVIRQDFIKTLRHQMAYCQMCDTEVDPSLTHPPYCESCDRRLDEQIASLASGNEGSTGREELTGPRDGPTAQEERH